MSRTRRRNHALQRQSLKEGEVKCVKCFVLGRLGKTMINNDHRAWQDGFRGEMEVEQTAVVGMVGGEKRL